jgi:hypothetical protein
MTPVSSRNETRSGDHCALVGCDNPVILASTGRPARYCSAACRARAHRQRHPSTPAVAHVEMGSATSRGRHPDKAWTVRLRRGTRTIVVALGLTRRDADRLAEQINDLLGRTT